LFSSIVACFGMADWGAGGAPSRGGGSQSSSAEAEDSGNSSEVSGWTATRTPGPYGKTCKICPPPFCPICPTSSLRSKPAGILALLPMFGPWPQPELCPPIHSDTYPPPPPLPRPSISSGRFADWVNDGERAEGDRSQGRRRYRP
jgi:hypothetical protein